MAWQKQNSSLLKKCCSKSTINFSVVERSDLKSLFFGIFCSGCLQLSFWWHFCKIQKLCCFYKKKVDTHENVEKQTIRRRNAKNSRTLFLLLLALQKNEERFFGCVLRIFAFFFCVFLEFLHFFLCVFLTFCVFVLFFDFWHFRCVRENSLRFFFWFWNSQIIFSFLRTSAPHGFAGSTPVLKNEK